MNAALRVALKRAIDQSARKRALHAGAKGCSACGGSRDETTLGCRTCRFRMNTRRRRARVAA